MRDAGAEEFRLHITYDYDTQCALGFSKEELRMIREFDCELTIDCVTADRPESGASPDDGPVAPVDTSNVMKGPPSVC